MHSISRHGRSGIRFRPSSFPSSFWSSAGSASQLAVTRRGRGHSVISSPSRNSARRGRTSLKPGPQEPSNGCPASKACGTFRPPSPPASGAHGPVRAGDQPTGPAPLNDVKDGRHAGARPIWPAAERQRPADPRVDVIRPAISSIPWPRSRPARRRTIVLFVDDFVKRTSGRARRSQVERIGGVEREILVSSIPPLQPQASPPSIQPEPARPHVDLPAALRAARDQAIGRWAGAKTLKISPHHVPLVSLRGCGGGASSTPLAPSPTPYS